MSIEQAIQALTKYRDTLVSSMFKADQDAQKAEFYNAFEILHTLKESHAHFMSSLFSEFNQHFDALIQHIERLKTSGEEPTTDLTIALEGTFNLLKNRIFALFNFARACLQFIPDAYVPRLVRGIQTI